MTYNGNVYSTLADVDVDGGYTCQSGFLPLPPGWQLAPDNAASIAVVGVSTNVFSVVSEKGYMTSENGASAGRQRGPTASVTSGSTY